MIVLNTSHSLQILERCLYWIRPILSRSLRDDCIEYVPFSPDPWEMVVLNTFHPFCRSWRDGCKNTSRPLPIFERCLYWIRPILPTPPWREDCTKYVPGEQILLNMSRPSQHIGEKFTTENQKRMYPIRPILIAHRRNYCIRYVPSFPLSQREEKITS